MAQNPYLMQIYTGSLRRGLDPSAVAAVASTEGGFGGPSSAPGDGGTSFGPFQLHAGGALPAGVAARGSGFAQRWAWSPAGISYALDRIASVAKGLGGQASVTAIVTKFERPADPTSQIAKALSRYDMYSGPGSIPQETGSAADAGSYDAKSAAHDVAQATGINSIVDFLKRLGDPNLWLRIGQVVAGAVLAFAGIVLLVKQVGLAAPSAPGIVGKTAEAVT